MRGRGRRRRARPARGRSCAGRLPAGAAAGWMRNAASASGVSSVVRGSYKGFDMTSASKAMEAAAVCPCSSSDAARRSDSRARTPAGRRAHGRGTGNIRGRRRCPRRRPTPIVASGRGASSRVGPSALGGPPGRVPRPLRCRAGRPARVAAWWGSDDRARAQVRLSARCSLGYGRCSGRDRDWCGLGPGGRRRVTAGRVRPVASAVGRR